MLAATIQSNTCIPQSQPHFLDDSSTFFYSPSVCAFFSSSRFFDSFEWTVSDIREWMSSTATTTKMMTEAMTIASGIAQLCNQLCSINEYRLTSHIYLFVLKPSDKRRNRVAFHRKHHFRRTLRSMLLHAAKVYILNSTFTLERFIFFFSFL